MSVFSAAANRGLNVGPDAGSDAGPHAGSAAGSHCGPIQQPILLALESGGETASVAVMSSSGEIAHLVAESGQSHSSRLLPMAQSLLGAHGLGWGDLDAIVVGTGPGSFTGLRMACGLAQGIALGTGVRLLAVSAFEAWAYAWQQSHRDVPVGELSGAEKSAPLSISFDARLGERFAARVQISETDGGLEFRWLSQPEVLASSLIHESPWSDDIGLHDPVAGQLGLSDAPLAVWMLRYARRVLASGRAHLCQAHELQPLYVRNKVARTLAERASHPDLQWSDMTLADLPRVMAIEHRAYPFPWTEGNFADSLQAGYHLRILREHGTIVGYMVWMLVVDEAHLLNITITPERQGRGLGAWMMRQFMAQAWAHGATGILLEVRPSNRRAISLYRRLGCREIGLRKGYYPQSAAALRPGKPLQGDIREDALVMRRLLSGQDAARSDDAGPDGAGQGAERGGTQEQGGLAA